VCDGRTYTGKSIAPCRVRRGVGGWYGVNLAAVSYSGGVQHNINGGISTDVFVRYQSKINFNPFYQPQKTPQSPSTTPQPVQSDPIRCR